LWYIVIPVFAHEQAHSVGAHCLAEGRCNGPDLPVLEGDDGNAQTSRVLDSVSDKSFQDEGLTGSSSSLQEDPLGLSAAGQGVSKLPYGLLGDR
jgi:hypothetical protein